MHNDLRICFDSCINIDWMICIVFSVIQFYFWSLIFIYFQFSIRILHCPHFSTQSPWIQIIKVQLNYTYYVTKQLTFMLSSSVSYIDFWWFLKPLNTCLPSVGYHKKWLSAFPLLSKLDYSQLGSLCSNRQSLACDWLTQQLRQADCKVYHSLEPVCLL